MEKFGIIKLKSKFFFSRAMAYASFLLIPVWITKFVDLTPPIQIFIIFLYILFIVSQWFLLGKEIDHVFKIYFRVNSSMDRIIYRLLLGMIIMVIYFGILAGLPSDIFKHFFWGTWIFLGLFYSWPTRGKIIEESITGQLIDLKFLDTFEKITMALTILLIIISLPRMPNLDNVEALKLYFDPMEKISFPFWNFLKGTYFPFYKFPKIFKMTWCLHFYIVGTGLFLFTFYAILRFFVSRRLSILGVFSVVSSWSFSKILGQNLAYSINTTYSILLIWAFFWCLQSSTYRSGLLLGLLGFWGTVINPNYIFILPIYLLLIYLFFLNYKTSWYRQQLLKYSLFGLALSTMIYIINFDSIVLDKMNVDNVYLEILNIVERKAFFVLSPIGLIVFLLMLFKKTSTIFSKTGNEISKNKELLICLIILFTYSLFLTKTILGKLSLMGLMAFFSVVPLEWIFHSIARSSTRRNITYVIYMLICLLDSHFEGRVKIILEYF